MNDNSISKYLGRNDLIKALAKIEVVQGTARESGNTYYAIELTFINGYKARIFLRGAESFAWCNAFDMIQTQQQIDSDF